MKKFYILSFFCFVAVLHSQTIDVNNQIMLAQSFESAGEYQKAKTIYEEIYRRMPDNPVVYQALNNVYLQLKEYAFSENLLKERIAASPSDVNLFGLLGKTLYLSGREDQTFALWKSFLKAHSSNQHYYKILANYALEVRNFDYALEFLKDGKKLFPDPRIFSYDLANLYSIMMQYKEAAKEFAEILIVDPNQVRGIESRLLQYSSKPEMLEASIDVFTNYDFKTNFAFAYILMQLEFLNKNYSKAFEYGKIIDAQQKNGVELFTLASKIFSAKNYSVASAIYKYLLEEHSASPFVANVKYGLAKTLEAEKNEEFEKQIPEWKVYFVSPKVDESQYSSVFEAYSELTKSFPSSDVSLDAELNKTKIYYEKIKDFEKANHLADGIISKYPLSNQAIAATLVKSEIFIKKGDFNNASILLEQIIDSPRTNDEQKQEANFLLMNIFFFKGDFETAKNYSSMLTNELTNDRANDAISFLLLANTKMNDSLALIKYGIASQKIFAENYLAAIEILRELINLQNSLPLQQLSKIKLAHALTAVDDYFGAIKIVGSILTDKMNIYSDEALYLQGKIYLFGIKDFAKAKNSFEQLLVDFPNSIFSDEVREILKSLRTAQS